MLGAIIDSINEAMTATRIARHSHQNIVSVKRRMTKGSNVRVEVVYEDNGCKRLHCFVIATLEAKS